MISRLSLPEHDFVLEYCSDTATFLGRLEREHEEKIATGLLTAVKKLANNDIQTFLQFFDNNAGSDLLSVHCLLAQGLVEVSASQPQKVLEYLLGDPRRLSLGDFDDRHAYTKQLIAGVFPYLEQVDRLRLEEAVLSYNQYKKVLPEWDAEGRRSRLVWNRQHRLRLLRAFPEDYLSLKIQKIKAEEERTFPELRDYDSKILGGFIGPRINANKMAKASDDELINLFNQLPDETKWDNPKRRFEDTSHGGGSVQQSREFTELAQNDPQRAVRIIRCLEPGRHEYYAGAGIEGLAESEFPLAEVIRLVEDLDRKGFTSEEFRCDSLGVTNTAKTEIKIGTVHNDERLSALLSHQTANLDELNFLMKRLDSFEQNELATFFAVAYAEKAETMTELINLSFNTHCYSLVADFSDLML